MRNAAGSLALLGLMAVVGLYGCSYDGADDGGRDTAGQAGLAVKPRAASSRRTRIGLPDLPVPLPESTIGRGGGPAPLPRGARGRRGRCVSAPLRRTVPQSDGLLARTADWPRTTQLSSEGLEHQEGETRRRT